MLKFLWRLLKQPLFDVRRPDALQRRLDAELRIVRIRQELKKHGA